MAEEKEQQDKFGFITGEDTTTKDVYISKAHQKALATDDDDTVNTSDTKTLTKGNEAPPSANPDNDVVNNKDELSTLTGETRESNAKAYAAEESKKWQRSILVPYVIYRVK